MQDLTITPATHPRWVIFCTEDEQSEISGILDNCTGGVWRSYVTTQVLAPVDTRPTGVRPDQVKAANAAQVKKITVTRLDTQNWVPKHLVSHGAMHTISNLKLCSWSEIKRKAFDAMQEWQIDYRHSIDKEYAKAAKIDREQWIRQFVQIAGDEGARLAKGLLAQTRFLRASTVVARIFDDDPAAKQESGDPYRRHIYFFGKDRHGGDYAFVNPLAGNVRAENLWEAFELPAQKDSGNRLDYTHVTLYRDAAWSGGEAIRTISCLLTPCQKKLADFTKVNLDVRFCFATDFAKDVVDAEIALIRKYRSAQADSAPFTVDVHIAPGGLLPVGCHSDNTEGIDSSSNRVKSPLALQNEFLLDYVNPKDKTRAETVLRDIGNALISGKPLGTREIASTIGFEFSLPGAMLPALRIEADVVNMNGQTFRWQPLVKSKHVSAGADADRQDYYCAGCMFDKGNWKKRNVLLPWRKMGCEPGSDSLAEVPLREGGKVG